MPRYPQNQPQPQPQPTKPPPTPAERAMRLAERMNRTELMIEKSDQRRVKLLLRAAQLAADQEDFAAVHGYAAEVATLCRSRVLGVRAAYPILSTLPPQAKLPSGMVVEVPDENG